jgi:D-3-phosphoglycerate dehydrogenase
MNCLAVADRLLTSKDWDVVLKDCNLFSAYRSITWDEGTTRADFRNVIRRLEVYGSLAYEPSSAVFEAIKETDILFVHQHPVPSRLMDAAPCLKYIISARGGVENIDIAAAKQRGITVINCPAHNAVAVAEYTIGLMICEMRNITRADRALRSGVWREDFPNSDYIGELSDAVVGIVGFGTIGKLVVQRLVPFGTRIIACDPYVNVDDIRECGVEKTELDKLLETADIISLHGRIPPGAPPLIGRRELGLMKSTAYLINTARAALVDMRALQEAVKQRRVMGAAVDVFPAEPIPKDDPLLQLDEITLTNHRGGDTYNCFAKAPVLLLELLREYLATGETKFQVC